MRNHKNNLILRVKKQLTNNKNMKLKLLIAALAFCSLFSSAQQTSEKFVVEMEYLLYLPDGYENDTTKKWPLMLFLHGAGEQGTDLSKVKAHGPAMHVDQGKKYPFILVSPQAQRGWKTEMLFNLLTSISKEKRVDTDRIYLTGLSMGGFGTWDLAMKHPELFAAIVPICGGGDPKDIWKLRHMPVWCFHGEKDQIVPIKSSERMVNALKEYCSNVQFTVYPDVWHDSWKKAYEDPKLYEWLSEQERFKFKQVKVDETILKDYTGDYLFKKGSFEANLKVFLEDNKLIGEINGRKLELKPSSETNFFMDENKLVEFVFERTDNGKVNRIKMYDDEITYIQKLN